jgi:dTMP kinase
VARERGKFITFEGGEGVGKSTQCSRLSQFLSGRGIDAVLTREPGGSDGADQIRELLVTGDEDRWDSVSETLLLLAARRDHLKRTILPALDAGIWVISDRFQDSTLAYQGYGHGLDLGFIGDLNRYVCGDVEPDLTFVLNAPTTLGISRALARGGSEDRFERIQLEFHNRAKQGFEKIAAEFADRCRLIDATKPADEIQAEITDSILSRFKAELAAV